MLALCFFVCLFVLVLVLVDVAVAVAVAVVGDLLRLRFVAFVVLVASFCG